MRTLSAVTFFVLFIAFGCTKTETPKEIAKIKDHFTLKQSIHLGDEGPNKTDKSGKLFDASGIIITIENSNPVISTTTNSKGEINLSIDTALKSFTLIYAKPLYGTFKKYYTVSNDSLYQVRTSSWDSNSSLIKRYVGWESIVEDLDMGLTSTVTVNSLQASIVNGQLKLTCNISTPNTQGETYVRLFYQRNLPFTSFATVLKNEKTMSGQLLVHNGSNVLDFCARCCLYGYSGMNSGDTVYMTAYGDSFIDNIYKDIFTNQLVMPNINLSNHIMPISFVLP